MFGRSFGSLGAGCRLTLCLVVAVASLESRCASAAGDYCKIKTCNGKQHTMCRFTSSKPSKSCSKYVPSPLTSAEQGALVNKHNVLRKQVADGLEKRGAPGPQPPASNMKELVWDSELATVAQRWADQCSNGHDTCRDVERFRVGQNIATQWNSQEITDPVETMVEPWYEEVKKFNKNGVNKYKFQGATGHYTQVVWAETKYVGCGRIKVWDGSKRMNMVRLICNYGPAGNFMDNPMYKVGRAGSGCPNGKGTTEGLCA